MTARLTLLADEAALGRIGAPDIRVLTEAATRSTFYRSDLDEAQLAANRNVVELSGPTGTAAARNGHQRLVAAFSEDSFAGFMIATRHDPVDLELDWLMVHPDHHGTGVAAALLQAGLEWLGAGHPIWLTVIKHNERAIRFYERFGFRIAGETEPRRVIPTWIMRREPSRAES